MPAARSADADPCGESRNARRARRAGLTALYFAEGAPLGFFYWYLGAHLASRGVADEDIGELSALLVLPWALKFLWAPVVDRLAASRCGVRGAVLVAQCGMVLTLVPLALFAWERELALLTACAVLHSFCAATQDVAIDAWMIRITPERDRGATTAWMQAGYRGAMWLFGYGALWWCAALDRRLMLLALAGAIVASGFAALLLRAPAPFEARAGGAGAALAQLLRRSATWRTLGFALVAGAGFEAAGAGLGRYLLTQGLDEAGIGRIASASIAALVPGGFLGGAAADRLGAARASCVAGLLVAAAVALLALARPAHAAPWMAVGACFYFAVGAFTAASYAWFVERSTAALAGTSFSLFMAGTNACESWSALALGYLVASAGWTPALLFLGLIGFCGLAFLPSARAAKPSSHVGSNA